ncbi:nucleotidyltransferase family protein [Halosimplex rubrum]|uniref:Nucleotidyltransferase family protein n=1 Tax=Halosimplex rubrum TaxID=869889 RepID=A0A7D5TBF9_9EURY|nr:nucleotidyltransferase family protein [Halosimplex rubrum]QLH76396.1 nucleotidyltransferase family protein [Halosimplex rubrum]
MTADRTVAGVLLAAGSSDRFGEPNKLLATLDGEPLVRHAARTITEAEVGPVAAVVDPESSGVRDALAGLDVTTVENPGAAAGQAASVRRGVAWARERADAVAFALGDMPRVDPETVDRLVGAYREGRGSALAAGYDGRRGNPVLFDGRHFDALAAVEGDTGGRAVFERADDAAVVETGDPGVHVDVDTVADLGRLRD